MSVDAIRVRGNFCFKSFQIGEKTLDEIQNYCGRLSSKLITNELLHNQNSTLKNELEFVLQRRFRTLRNNTYFGLNTDLQGIFENHF